MKQSIWISWSVLWLGMLACQPVFVIGWREFFIILILVVLLIGLPLYRFIRRSKTKDE
jgi:hypothetical protein